MISKGYLTAKIREICIWKGQNPTSNIIDLIHPKFERLEEKDLDQAAKEIMAGDDKFTPALLKMIMNRIQITRHNAEWEETKVREARETGKFWGAFQGNCQRQSCRGCQHAQCCHVRQAEWIKGIKIVLWGEGPGKERAEQLIHYMKHDFMGGL